MSTSGMNKATGSFKRKKTLLNNKCFVFVVLAGLCIGIDNIYAIFGHEVRSSYMSFMFLYPLGGSAVYFLLGRLLPHYGVDGSGRLGVNLFNSGLATLTISSFLVGILEIAGSSSAFVPLFYMVGWGFLGIGLLLSIYTGVCKK